MRSASARLYATVTDRAHFDYLRIVGGYEVSTDWNDSFGTLLVPRDQEDEHDLRRRELGKMTVADMRAGKCDWITKLMADFEARRQ